MSARALRTLIVTWHPEPKSMCSSIFRATAEQLKAQGHEVKVSDLHSMIADGTFNPVSGPHNFDAEAIAMNKDFFKQQAEENKCSVDPETGLTKGFSPNVAREIEKLIWCDLVLFVFPLWWFSVPAAMKGWFDSTLAAGICYGGKAGIYDKATFGKGKRAMLVLTTGGGEDAYKADGFNGLLDGVVRHIHRGVFAFCGFSVLSPSVCYSAAHGTDEDRQKWLVGYKQRLAKIDEQKPIDAGKYA